MIKVIVVPAKQGNGFNNFYDVGKACEAVEDQCFNSIEQVLKDMNVATAKAYCMSEFMELWNNEEIDISENFITYINV